MRLADLPTPALVLDRRRMDANAARMTAAVAARGARFRPHLKTAKSLDAAAVALEGNFGGITVATLNEAEYFAAGGIEDILYAVCVTPDKLPRAAGLLARGIRLSLILDGRFMADAVARWARDLPGPVDVLIEIDSGEHRTGLEPDDPAVVEIASALCAAPGVCLAGVMTHAGHAYHCRSRSEIARVAEDEALAAVRAAGAIRAAGLPCPTVSVGSTPTALRSPAVAGVTEVRAGVYLFGDLFQAAIGSCAIADVALSVLATVISHRPAHNHLLLDAGALALSKDRSTAATPEDAGYGLLTDGAGRGLLADLHVSNVHQEHGEVSSASPLPYERMPIGSRVRVLPNHACMTAAMYDRYYVVDGPSDEVVAVWPKTNGWEPA